MSKKLSRRERNEAKWAARAKAILAEHEAQQKARAAETEQRAKIRDELKQHADLAAPDLTTKPAPEENPLNQMARKFGASNFSHGAHSSAHHRPAITEIVREAEAGGVVYRITKSGKLQIALFQDVRDRWTIPKGHLEEGETAQEAAIREISEEIGLFGIEPICWLGKVNFRYRRENTLVIINMQTYLFKAGHDENLKKEEWMHDVRWFDFDEAITKIAYDDVAKLALLGKKRLRQRGEIE
jgi:8-oxo-dGTP pyrophosphatase MutT (NUDIX family)